ncbi:MAG: hypothetical protein QM808_11965 [Steroidobacteraceae bacterium]
MSTSTSALPLLASDLSAAMPDEASAQARTSGNWLRTTLWVVPILTATLFAKIAVPPLGAQGIGIALPILLALTLMGCITQQFTIAAGRFAFGALVLGLLGTVQLLKNDVYSLSSLLLLSALHMPFLLRLRGEPWDIDRAVRFFLAVCTVCACCGIAQAALRGLVETQWLFPIDSFIPEQFLIQNFNEVAPLEYGSTVIRANGVFMMEPSYLSQLLAVAIIVELVTRNRWWLWSLYGIAMLVSYSGTGFMVLGLCVPVVLLTQQRWGLLVAMVVGGLLFGVIVENFGQYLYLDTFMARTGEFNSTGSSGFARFVGGFYLFDQFLWDQPLRALIGTGAGTFKEYAPLAHFPVAEMPLFKMVLEFGLLGALLYFSFLFFCLSSSALPGPVALAVGATFLLNGLYVPFSHALALTLLVWTSLPSGVRRSQFIRARETTERIAARAPAIAEEVPV